MKKKKRGKKSAEHLIMNKMKREAPCRRKKKAGFPSRLMLSRRCSVESSRAKNPAARG